MLRSLAMSATRRVLADQGYPYSLNEVLMMVAQIKTLTIRGVSIGALRSLMPVHALGQSRRNQSDVMILPSHFIRCDRDLVGPQTRA